jgi:hypothetical protein
MELYLFFGINPKCPLGYKMILESSTNGTRIVWNEDGNRQGKTMILYLFNQSSRPGKIQWGLRIYVQCNTYE